MGRLVHFERLSSRAYVGRSNGKDPAIALCRGRELLLHHRIELRQHLGARGQFVQAAAQAYRVRGAVAQRTRVHGAGGAGLVQPHEGIGIVPVAAGAVVAVDDEQSSAPVSARSTSAAAMPIAPAPLIR
jgi:hypothetical protein